MPARSGDVFKKSGVELRTMIARRELSPLELVEHLLDRVARIDPHLHAFCYIDADAVRAQARQMGARTKSSEPLPEMFGLPVSVKDLIITKGMRTTRGSLFFEHDVPTQDAPVVERLRAAGAIVFGKTNTSEFGWKGATSNRVFPETLNPWDRARTPGGSSGGAAASLAAGLCPLALGTDGGGSVRIPASFCAVFGFKPSLGRFPLFPPAPVGPLSHVGPMSRTVDDAALMLRVLSGPDLRDVYSLPATREFGGELTPIKGLRVGWSPDLGCLPVEPEVRRICEAAVRRFEDAGCDVIPLDVGISDPRDHLEVMFGAGIGCFVTKLPGWRERLDKGLVGLVEAGQARTGFEFAQAMIFRAELGLQIARAMEGVDVLVTPTVPVTAFSRGLDAPEEVAGEPTSPVRWLALTGAFNLTGQPAASVPCGFASNGMPVGLQIVGPRYGDWMVLQACKTFEEIAPWRDYWPAPALE